MATGPAGQEPAATGAGIKVYKTAACGCCKAWIAHLEDAGFRVEGADIGQERLYRMKREAGLTRELASCHTAFVDGYVVEGHVPAADIRRLLEQRPEVKGLAVPGMPVGSPGMEVGSRRDPYDVLGFDEAGNAGVFSSSRR